MNKLDWSELREQLEALLAASPIKVGSYVEVYSDRWAVPGLVGATGHVTEKLVTAVYEPIVRIKLDTPFSPATHFSGISQIGVHIKGVRPKLK